MGRLEKYGLVIAALLAAAFFVSPCNRNVEEKKDVSDIVTCTGRECSLEFIGIKYRVNSFYPTEDSVGYDSSKID